MNGKIISHGKLAVAQFYLINLEGAKKLMIIFYHLITLQICG